MSGNQHQLPMVAAGLASKRHRRATLWMIRRAIRDGWAIDPRQRDELFRLAFETTEQAFQENDVRVAGAGTLISLELANHNLQVLVALDELERARRQAEEQERRKNVVFGKAPFRDNREVIDLEG